MSVDIQSITLTEHLVYLEKKNKGNSYTWGIRQCEGEQDRKTGKKCTCQHFHVRVYLQKPNIEGQPETPRVLICNSSITSTNNCNEYIFQVENKRILLEWFL
jgi:hypothetical protein